MIKTLEFTNFRVLKHSTCELNQCTLLLGPNGSGKSTVITALQLFAEWARGRMEIHHPTQKIKRKPEADDASFGVARGAAVEVAVDWMEGNMRHRFTLK